MTQYYFGAGTNLVQAAPTLILDRTFYEGIILGLQETAVTTSDCYEDFGIFADFVWSAQYAVLFDTYKASAIAKGQQPTDGGFFTQFQEFMVDFFLLFFNVFQSCYLENLFMLIGTFVQSPSGASNYAVTIGYEFFNY